LPVKVHKNYISTYIFTEGNNNLFIPPNIFLQPHALVLFYIPGHLVYNTSPPAAFKSDGTDRCPEYDRIFRNDRAPCLAAGIFGLPPQKAVTIL
jgi:hypothetical protein